MSSAAWSRVRDEPILQVQLCRRNQVPDLKKVEASGGLGLLSRQENGQDDCRRQGVPGYTATSQILATVKGQCLQSNLVLSLSRPTVC